MKLASYNIQYGTGRDGCVDLDRIVAELGDADLIALQEVERYAERSGMVDQVAEIARRLPRHFWVYGPGIDLDASEVRHDRIVNQRRQFGNMVLSRWPILSSINHTLPKIALHKVMHMQRTLVETVIDAPGAPLRFVSVHLDHISTDTRMPQVDYMVEIALHGPERGPSLGGRGPDTPWLDRPEPPQPRSVIVMGDMNFLPGSPEYSRVCGTMSKRYGRTTRAGGLLDAWTLTGHDEHEGDTLPRDTRPEPMRIDHCFVSTDLAPALRSMHIDDTACGSDHQPIFVTLDT